MIELKNVTKKYGDFIAIDNISFKIEKGDIVGLLGENGAGKTTIMKLITGLTDPTCGEIFVNGEKITNKTKKIIGYMPENTPLYHDLTVKEFINYMSELKSIKRKNRKNEVERLIKELGLENVKNKIIKNLSKGYKQRVSMAGALVGNPEIIILDEPTVGLDPKQIIEIRNLIKNLRKEHTILFSSHILSEVNQLCKKIIVVHQGKIIFEDNSENILEKDERCSLIVILEDEHNCIKKIQNEMPEIKEIKLIEKFEKNIYKYEIIVTGERDIRKELSKKIVDNDATIIELKKSEKNLENIFLNLIEEKKERGE